MKNIKQTAQTFLSFPRAAWERGTDRLRPIKGSDQQSGNRFRRQGTGRPRGIRRRRVGTRRYGVGIFSLLLMVLMVFSVWFSGPEAAHAAIPEPETLLYGSVINRSGGQEYLLTEGQMEWVISDHANSGATFTFTTDLEPLGEGQFSYRLRIPHETALAGEILSPDSLPVYSEEMRYDHVSVTINGSPAAIIPPAREFFNVNQGSRMTPYRIDLEVVFELSDTDGDGMPDWWEDEYGLDKNRPGDATEDPDDDGATNLAEYLAGTDPLVSNRSPVIATGRILVYESAITAIFPDVHDSDSAPADITYFLRRAPEGGTLYLRDGSGSPDVYGLNTGRILAENDTFTHEDVNQGRLQFSHEDVTITDISFDLSVADENPDHPPVNGTIFADISRPTALDGTEAALWLDANYEAAQQSELTVWQDRSGPKEWADGSTAPFDMTEIHGNAVPVAAEGPYGKPALVPDGAIFKGPSPDEATVLQNGPHTLFAVFKADGTEPRKILNTPDFDLALAGQLRHGTADTSVYTREPAAGQWILAAVQGEGNSAVLEINGRWAGGPTGVEEDNILGQSFTIAGATVSRFDTDQGGWVTEETGLFTGQLAEILAFDYEMDTERRRKITWHLLSKWFGYVMCDGSDKARSQVLRATDRPSILLGGPGDDALSGGGKNDILSGGPGDDTLTGGGGADIFILNDISDGGDTIVDFSPGQNDAVDFTGILNGTSTLLSDYVQITNNGTDTSLHIDADGQGSDYTDMVIRLNQNLLTNEHLPFLWANGNLTTGAVRFPLQVGIQTTRPVAVENAGESAIITISLTGTAIPRDLTIPFQVAGEALWKTDYVLQARLYNAETELYELTELDSLSVPVQLRSGDQSLEIHVVPLEDTEVEGLEDVVFTPSEQKSVYDLVDPSAAAVSITDGPASVTITVLRGSFNEGGGLGDELSISRSEAADFPLDVSLNIAGSAANGVDYSFIPEVITIPAGETDVKIPVKAYADQTVEPVEYIQVFIIPGSGYVPADPDEVTLSILDPGGPDEPPVTGNLNDDGAADLKDAILALQISAGITPSVRIYTEADVNGDGRLGVEEAVYILQLIAGVRQ